VSGGPSRNFADLCTLMTAFFDHSVPIVTARPIYRHDGTRSCVGAATDLTAATWGILDEVKTTCHRALRIAAHGFLAAARPGLRAGPDFVLPCQRFRLAVSQVSLLRHSIATRVQCCASTRWPSAPPRVPISVMKEKRRLHRARSTDRARGPHRRSHEAASRIELCTFVAMVLGRGVAGVTVPVFHRHQSTKLRLNPVALRTATDSNKWNEETRPSPSGFHHRPTAASPSLPVRALQRNQTLHSRVNDSPSPCHRCLCSAFLLSLEYKVPCRPRRRPYRCAWRQIAPSQNAVSVGLCESLRTGSLAAPRTDLRPRPNIALL